MSPLCINEEKWKKSWEIKLGLWFILEQCGKHSCQIKAEQWTASIDISFEN